MKQCKVHSYRVLWVFSFSLVMHVHWCCSTTFLCVVYIFLNSNWSHTDTHTHLHIDVSYGSTQRLQISIFSPFPWHFPVHIMRHRVRALKCFSFICWILEKFDDTDDHLPYCPSMSRYILWMVRPIRCYLLQVTFLWLTSHRVCVSFCELCFSAACSLFTCHLLGFHLLYTHTFIASINKIEPSY